MPSTPPDRAPGHVVLLGDSIFDNGADVGGAPDVVAQLRDELPGGWRATLAAVDGDVTHDVAHQLRRAPHDASHLVVSVGGNDALGHAHLLGAPVTSVADAVTVLSRAQDRFAADDAAMLDGVLAAGLPTAVCTVDDTHPDAPDHRVVRSALALFNDVITRSAFARGVDVVDLRLVCTEPGDHANPIEPSEAGGRRIARSLAALLVPEHRARRSQVVA